MNCYNLKGMHMHEQKETKVREHKNYKICAPRHVS